MFTVNKYSIAVIVLVQSQFLKRMSRLSKPKAIDLQIGDWVIIPSTFNKRTVQVDYNNKQFWRPANGLIKLNRSRGEEKL